MKNKKAELTSKQLITIIILIISFTIIIAFFVMLGLKSMIGDNTCRNSIMLKSSLPIPIFKDLISLKCKTKDICFTMSGECDEKVDEVIEVKDDVELIMKLGDLQKDCGWMTGEGKADYGGKGDCAICYKLYFDEKIKTTIPVIRPNRQVFTDELYVVVTGRDKDNDRYLYPNFVKFNTDALKTFGCTNFITEI